MMFGHGTNVILVTANSRICPKSHILPPTGERKSTLCNSFSFQKKNHKYVPQSWNYFQQIYWFRTKFYDTATSGEFRQLISSASSHFQMEVWFWFLYSFFCFLFYSYFCWHAVSHFLDCLIPPIYPPTHPHTHPPACTQTHLTVSRS